MHEYCERVKSLRQQTGLSQSKFAGFFEIPVSTLQYWEQGLRTPPVYVVNMMETILRFKEMI